MIVVLTIDNEWNWHTFETFESFDDARKTDPALNVFNQFIESDDDVERLKTELYEETGTCIAFPDENNKIVCAVIDTNRGLDYAKHAVMYLLHH